MKRLILIDTHAIIHRAYHALPPLSSPSGKPVNAVYGFASILLRIINELKPDYVAAAMDLPKPTFRHVAYERYKAQRPEAPDDLAPQFGEVRELLESFGISVFAEEGYEADDIIGTLSAKADKKKEVETIVVTGDMDALQLVGPNLRVFTMRKGIKDTVIYDEKAVGERYGLKPEQLVDFRGLKGDPSDNIAGVKGIGEKTASELIKNFSSLEGVYKALDKNDKKISLSIAQKLKTGREEAFLSKTLSEIKKDVPLNFVWEDLAWRKEDLQKKEVFSVLDKFGFSSLIKRLNGENSEKRDSVVENKGKKTQTSLLEEKENKEMKGQALLRVPEGMELSVFLRKEVEEPLVPILRKMEKTGILLDLDFLKKFSSELSKKIRRLTSGIYELADEVFNINSTRELSRILFEKLRIPAENLRRTEKSGVISTGASELEKLKSFHPIVSKILEYRELSKLQNTYVEVLPKLADKKDNRIHTTFHQFGAVTGRLSSSDPNLQNIPIMSEEGREIRKAFIAESGFKLVSFDYSQIELRLAAHMAGDKKMIDAFRRGEDIHKLTACEVYNLPSDKITPELRRAAKTLNFGVLYGMGVQAFAESTGMSRTDAKKFIDEYFNDFSGIKKYIEETKQKALREGFVETIFGRRRYISEISTGNWRYRREAERMAVNAPIQGSAADVVKIAMVKIDKFIKNNKLNEKVRMLLQVHDELVFEVREDSLHRILPQIKSIMESGVIQLKVPLLVEEKIGKNWGENA